MKGSVLRGKQRKYLGMGCMEHLPLPPPFYPICGRNHEDFDSEMQVRKDPAPFPQDSMNFVIFELILTSFSSFFLRELTGSKNILFFSSNNSCQKGSINLFCHYKNVSQLTEFFLNRHQSGTLKKPILLVCGSYADYQIY